MSDFALFGRNLFGDAIQPKTRGPVAERFTFPPFTVLDARSGEWQDRKRAWTTVGLQGEIGRECRGSNSWHDLALNPRAAESTRKNCGGWRRPNDSLTPAESSARRIRTCWCSVRATGGRLHRHVLRLMNTRLRCWDGRRRPRRPNERVAC